VVTRTALCVFVEVPVHLAAVRKLLGIPASPTHRVVKHERHYETTRKPQRVEQALRRLKIVDWPSEREVARTRGINPTYETRVPKMPRWRDGGEREETGSAK